MLQPRPTLIAALLLVTAPLVPGRVLAQKANEFVANLKDGKTVTGTLRKKTVKIKTRYGYAVVQVARLGSITFGEPDILLTTDEDELRGTLEPKSFQLQQGRDRTTVRRRQLVSLSRMVDGRPFGVVSFAGEWSTNFGPMTLEQQGKQIKGSYGYGGEALSGELDGGETELAYSGGKVTFELSDDGELLTGKYAGDNGRKGFWGGYRIKPAVAEPKPGVITSGQTKSWLNYHLRVPKGYAKGKRYPAIAFLHGSNMTSRAYVNTIASVWPKLAEDYILVGFDGENLSPSAKPERRAYNFSYVNFSGHEVGSKGRYRQSPALVAEALDQLKQELPIEHWFVGGHSQGGFLTYAIAMFYPGKVAGVFPMSCNLLVQCAPSYFKDKPEAFRQQQRAVPIAVVHGENDNVVAFSGGEHCFRSMVDGGFPMVRFFRHKTAAHMFARLPVKAAVRWLEALNSKDATELLAFADQQLEDGRYRDATAAVLRARKLGVPSDLRGNFDALSKRLDGKARPDAGRLLQAIKKNRNNEWVDGFLAYRREFAFTDAAKPVMAAYAELRQEHAAPADKIFYAARRIRDKDEREAKYQEILDKYYASKWYEMVKGWLED